MLNSGVQLRDSRPITDSVRAKQPGEVLQSNKKNYIEVLEMTYRCQLHYHHDYWICLIRGLRKMGYITGGGRFSMIKVASLLQQIYDWLLITSAGLNLTVTNRRVSESFYKRLQLPGFSPPFSSRPISKAAMPLAQMCHSKQASPQIQAVNTRQASFISSRTLSRLSFFCISPPGGLTLPWAHTRPRGSTPQVIRSKVRRDDSRSPC